ncbi:hypothetical protein NE237_026003 [Protea cynaroides]|uniref:Acyl-[acyl-carrier-protein] hydrolase n=1 Tax=Protea cynaroides TaxID=273540 RepID=A0A9Q0K121_9MAGN|nr:hypothetical protein NE237_026003 [Protea cynaroides]
MAATSMMMMMQGREVNPLGTLRFKSKAVPASSNGVLMVRASLQTSSMKDQVEKILKMTAPKQWTKLFHRREREGDMVVNPFSIEEIVKDKRIFSQDFTIRSYDMGPSRTATIETLMNLLQETALNHIRNMGLLNDGLGSTPEMSEKNLIWVLSNMHVVVDHYPSWDDNVQVDNWFISSGNNGQCTEWIIRDCWTKKIYARATSKFVMMNKETRKLSKIPGGVKREMESQYLHCSPIMDGDNNRLPKLDHSRMEHVRTGLTPRWSDLDANQHVNNVKYVGLMLESVPTSFLKSHELSGITMEYRKECGKEDVLQSLTDCSIDADECNHLLISYSGTIVARCRTQWRPKHAN